MARRPAPVTLEDVRLKPSEVESAITKLRRRIDELEKIDARQLTEESGNNVLASLAEKLNATLRDIFGMNSIQYRDFSVGSYFPRFYVFSTDTDMSIRGNATEIQSLIKASISRLRTLIDILEEQAGGGEPDPTARVLKAYQGLELHKEIARAASTLYMDGHYSNAVEASVKALNGLVRLRTGLEVDGTSLMERAFNPTNPMVKFNPLADQSDKDEQKGFMMMFSGAVAGLRNPRAHRFVNDDPERALEFIAFVSLLAKLLDQATQ